MLTILYHCKCRILQEKEKSQHPHMPLQSNHFLHTIPKSFVLAELLLKVYKSSFLKTSTTHGQLFAHFDNTPFIQFFQLFSFSEDDAIFFTIEDTYYKRHSFRIGASITASNMILVASSWLNRISCTGK